MNNNYLLVEPKQVLLRKVLDSLTDTQKTTMRDRIVEICYDDYLENVTQISYADLVSDLFYQTAEMDDWINFEGIPEEWLLNFIKANNKARKNEPAYDPNY